MRTFVGEVPLSVVAMVVVIVIVVVGSGALARWLGSGRWVAALLLLGFGIVLSATLVPTGSALGGEASDGVCDTSRLGLPPLDELARVTYTSLNVLLFVPLGIAVGLLPRTRASAAVLVAAVLLTFVVETVQLLLPVLGRGCQTADMVDNLLGLAVGLIAGVLLRPVARWMRPDPGTSHVA